MTSSRLRVVMFNWHAQGQSEAARDILLEPLAPYFSFDVRSIDWYDPPPASVLGGDGLPPVFFFTTPPFHAVGEIGAPVVWIPMGDAARIQLRDSWAHIPQCVRVIAFSKFVAKRAREAGIQTLEVQYFRDPAQEHGVDFFGPRVAYYWNRTGLVSPNFLRQWCQSLRVDTLLFKARMDPYADRRAYFELPDRLGATRVVSLPHTQSRADHFKMIERANIVLAPRMYEGVGLTFIEALSRGCVVFAHDGATMNEYIRNGESGILLSDRRGYREKMTNRVRRYLKLRPRGTQDGYRFRLAEVQPWSRFGRLDLATLGQQARVDHASGFARWRESIPQYAAFIRGDDT